MKVNWISIVAIIAAPAVAQQPRPAAPAAASVSAPLPASLAKGHQLAAMLNNDDVTKLQFDKMFSTTMPEAMRHVPTYQALEEQYPGIIMAIVNGSRPIIEAETEKQAPQLIDRLGALYGRNMTESELSKALDFYTSPTGAWVIETVATNSDAAAAMQKGIADPTASLTPDDVTKSTIDSALPSLIEGMTPERLKAASAFMATSAGQKIEALQPQANQITADWANRMKADAGPAVGAAVLGIAQKYIADHGGANKAATGS